jgi:hypothetical protein
MGKKGKFFDVDIAAIAQTATYTTLTPSIDVSRAKRCVLQAKATGEDAGAAADVTFHIAAVVGDRISSTLHSTSDLTTVTVTMAGAGIKYGIPVLIDCDGMTGLECTSIVNADAAKDALAVNLFFGLVEREGETLNQADVVLTGGS